MKTRTPPTGLPGWDRLSHGGLLLDPARLLTLSRFAPGPLSRTTESQLRKRANAVLEGNGDVSGFVAFVLEDVCGFRPPGGGWTRGSGIPPLEGRKAVTGETVKPRHLWAGPRGARLPVFFDDSRRLGIGRGRRVASRVFGWLRAGGEPLALLTNGREWRLLFAGLDYEAWCQWDLDLWFDEGKLTPQVTALRTLLKPDGWIPGTGVTAPPLLQAIRDTRKGQAELSEVLGERVREAVEILIRGHGEALRDRCAGVAPADIYRAACRVAMRLVVILFAEARGLLPRNNALYDASYGLNGLFERLDRTALRGGLANDFAAWPRVLALFALVRDGSHHPDLPVTAYGGELFAPGQRDDEAGVSRAVRVFETACFDREALPDRDVHEMLQLLTRTTVRIRQGRTGTRVPVPVDFSDLSSEYIGVLYEGLLDYELKAAPAHDPVVFLAVGDQAALPLSRLEAMDGCALEALFESLKTDRATAADDAAEEEAPEAEEDYDELVPEAAASAGETEASSGDERQRSRERAEAWARRAAQAAGLVPKPRGRGTPERRIAHQRKVAARARKLVARVVLPGDWYLVRWGGTRKGSGSFYTRPGLAVPTVHRTLRPLAYDPPAGADGSPDTAAPAARWTPKPPERILALTVCDPACGSGTFPLAALRFLTDALYGSLQHYGRLQRDGERTLVRLLGVCADAAKERLADELIPCPPDNDDFEPRLRAVLRRYVVERCIYAVDLDPLAVELCRLSLWIETMDRNLPFGFLDHKIKCGNALVGAWFDQFRHYPAMAWKNREGGDRNHANGVHFEKNARTKAIKTFVKDTLTPDLERFLRGPGLFVKEDLLKKTVVAHDEAFAVLAKCHALPVRDAAARARTYGKNFLGSPAWRSLKEAMDRWCACWFWPAEETGTAPLPRSFADPQAETHAACERIAAEMRFFHWELEFPDVFREAGSGFDAILGNPPWDTLQPNSKEFFSNLDPLYRSYGKQYALKAQTALFENSVLERSWLNYNSGFANGSNWMKYAGRPFGDPTNAEKTQDQFAVSRRRAEDSRLHDRWRQARSGSLSFADPGHPFIHRGKGKAYTYKLFLEQAHALCRDGGRLGFLVPSGLYSDHGTGALRDLFLERCRWEWLFGFENRNRIFPIASSYRFNPVIIAKAGVTDVIRTAFMRSNLDDWERAERDTMPYTKEQVRRFSPKSRAILEVESARDLEILDKIYSQGVLLGDDRTDAWEVDYAQGDFNMTSDSQLFSSRQEWESKGYLPDEYSRWLHGAWRPIAELWGNIDVKSFQHAGRGTAPPYDLLPVPRTEIPEGIVLSRTADAWIREEDIRHTALPLYVGKMVFVGSWIVEPRSRIRPGRTDIRPDLLIGADNIRDNPQTGSRIVFRGIARNTDLRSMVSTLIPGQFPCGNSLSILKPRSDDVTVRIELTTYLSSLTVDWSTRQRLAGVNLNWHIVESLAVSPPRSAGSGFVHHAAQRFLSGIQFAADWLRLANKTPQPRLFSASHHERFRLAIMLDAAAAAVIGLDLSDLRYVLRDCDRPHGETGTAAPKGFWRVDKDKDPELRHTVLTLVAFHDLEEKISSAGGDREKGIEAFLNQNDGEGWMLPETLRLADYGLGHDDRARRPQPVASRLGPRFFDWQLAQSSEESWRECHLHARNLLGEHRYRQLLEDIEQRREGREPEEADLLRVAEPEFEYGKAAPKDRKPPRLF